ncbi:MAG: hypothetical protein HKO92_05900 [Flavobacteriaceae bacterium]|nr:hypothetical protein [Flavobacteriaceae bacterium]
MPFHKLYLYICIFFITFSVTAQLDRTSDGFSIKPSDSLLNGEKAFTFKINPIVGLTNKNAKHKINFTPLGNLLNKSSGVDISKKSNLSHKEWKITQKFSEDRKDLIKYQRDFYLGDLKTTFKTVIIKFRDHEYVDGDRIKFMLNNAIVHPNITLTGSYYSIDIDLKEGFNTIHFVALNEGESSPNTAEVKVVDENGKLIASNNWLIRTGYKATLVILKE